MSGHRHRSGAHPHLPVTYWRVAWRGGSRGLATDPETLLVEGRDRTRVNELVAKLPAEFREVIVLREIEDLSYREIADIVGIPIGTVMSRLSRARKLLHDAWHRQQAKA